jgi:protocatechuate 3,4-dioxygenase beta subunit
MPPVTPSLASRRAVLAVGLGAVPLLGSSRAVGQPAAPPVVTPRQAAGPFYPLDWSGDADADLVRVTGEAAEAVGTVAHLRGHVLDARGAPVAGAVVEIWQCDAGGRYRHPRDRGEARRDPGFQGRGRATTGAEGEFAFRTIRPVAYPGRAPHIHVLVAAPGRRDPLVTQLYVAGEPLNERDGLFSALREPRQREALLLRFEPADRIEPGALMARRNLVLA